VKLSQVLGFYISKTLVYQLLAHGRLFSPGTPASSTTKTGHHDIAEILLKVALKDQNKIIKIFRLVNSTRMLRCG
jgi:hypothetical protein